MVASWLITLLQQFGRDIITGAPGAVEAVKREYEVAKDPYVDKHAYCSAEGEKRKGMRTTADSTTR